MISIDRPKENTITLTDFDGTQLIISWDSDHNYWYYTDSDEVEFTIDSGDGDLYRYLWKFIKSSIGSYYLYCYRTKNNRCPDFVKKNDKKTTITFHSNPITYENQEYVGATMQMEIQERGPIKLKLIGGTKIDNYTMLRIDPSSPNCPCYNETADLFYNLTELKKPYKRK